MLYTAVQFFVHIVNFKEDTRQACVSATPRATSELRLRASTVFLARNCVGVYFTIANNMLTLRWLREFLRTFLFEVHDTFECACWDTKPNKTFLCLFVYAADEKTRTMCNCLNAAYAYLRPKKLQSNFSGAPTGRRFPVGFFETGPYQPRL